MVSKGMHASQRCPRFSSTLNALKYHSCKPPSWALRAPWLPRIHGTILNYNFLAAGFYGAQHMSNTIHRDYLLQSMILLTWVVIVSQPSKVQQGMDLQAHKERINQEYHVCRAACITRTAHLCRIMTPTT
jgi:hypothetical protein